MTFCNWRCTILAVTLVVGVVSVLFGIFALFFVPRIVSNAVNKQTYLGKDSNGSDNLVLKMFRDPKYDVKLQVWVYSVQNTDAVLKKGAKPVLEEKGPYTYSVILHKTNVSFAANDTRLFFRNGKTYFFDQAQTCGNCSLDDKVTIPNILFQKIVDIVGTNHWLRPIVEYLIKDKESAFIEVSVDDLLFKGYEDALVKAICGHALVKPVCERYNVPERIGLFYGQNGTDDGLYEVDTGLQDVNLLDKVYSWNQMESKLSSNFWYNESARLINGTDAELYRPNLYSGQNLQIFIGQLCRSFELTKMATTTTSGIPVFRYGQPDTFLDTNVQRSEGFCNPNSPDYFDNRTVQQVGCAPSGLLDMSSCLPGNPRILWSASHFRNAPPILHLAGMAQPSEGDLSFFDIEPLTGAVVGVQQRSQLNLGMLSGNFSFTKNMRKAIVPIIWINESAVIDPKTRDQLLVPVEAMFYSFAGGLGLLIVGAVSLVCFAGIFIGLRIAGHRQRVMRQATDEDPLAPLITAEQPSLPNSAIDHFHQLPPPQPVPLPNTNA